MAGKGQHLFILIHLRGRTLRAMVDSGVTGNFIDSKVASENGFRLFRKKEPYRLTVVDGEAIGSNKGMVTHETDELEIRTTRGYTKDITFDVVTIGYHAVILGMPWLKLHNP
jgi:hypothetical protein